MGVRWLRVLGPAVLLVGIAVLVLALLTGVATLYLVVIFPVLTSSSPLFALGVLLLVAGIFLLPLAFAPGVEVIEPVVGAGSSEGMRGTRAEGSFEAGGLVLLGPVPIFLGAWKNPSRRAYWLAVLVGSIAVVAVFFVLFLVR